MRLRHNRLYLAFCQIIRDYGKTEATENVRDTVISNTPWRNRRSLWLELKSDQDAAAKGTALTAKPKAAIFAANAALEIE